MILEVMKVGMIGIWISPIYFTSFFLYKVNFVEILMIFVEIGNADVDLYYYDELSDRD